MKLSNQNVNEARNEEAMSSFAIICPLHGRVFLSHEEYDEQIRDTYAVWKCPRCGKSALFDDELYESHRFR